MRTSGFAETCVCTKGGSTLTHMCIDMRTDTSMDMYGRVHTFSLRGLVVSYCSFSCSHNCIGHNYMGHYNLGHNCIGHEYIHHDYIGHNYVSYCSFSSSSCCLRSSTDFERSLVVSRSASSIAPICCVDMCAAMREENVCSHVCKTCVQPCVEKTRADMDM